MAGCRESSPSPAVPAEQQEKTNSEDLKKMEGTWKLKSSLVSSGSGTYTTNPSQGAELVFRIKDGVMEMRVGNDPWVKHSTLTLGAEPQCLLSSRVDALSQKTTLKLRYKLEENTLVTVQDNLYSDVLPDSFNIESGMSGQRQITTYVRTDH